MPIYMTILFIIGLCVNFSFGLIYFLVLMEDKEERTLLNILITLGFIIGFCSILVLNGGLTALITETKI